VLDAKKKVKVQEGIYEGIWIEIITNEGGRQ
jgi:hypothetical protein